MYGLLKVELGTGAKAFVKGANKESFKDASLLRITLNRKHLDDNFYFLTVKRENPIKADGKKTLSGGGKLMSGLPIYRK